MKRVLTAVILIPMVLLLVFKGPFWLITLAAAAVAVLAAWEFLALADASGAKTPRIAVLCGIVLLFVCIFFRPEYATPLLGCLNFAVFIICAFRSPLPRVLPDTAYSVFGLLYIGLSLTTIPLLSAQENGDSLLVFLFFVVWVGDIVALYVGRAFGRRKLAPSISPNKTWEGSIGSVAGSLLVTLLLIFLGGVLTRNNFDLISYPGPVWRWLVLAVLLNIAAQVGDLIESAVKRGAGVKDSGSLLPGHGGILDRIDALLLAAPVLWWAQLAQQWF
ncbi:phosphatidate cytidylyltransferase [Alloacidobacterium sp.]|uniref:phosphatidate cytidylyltransferase n=1 Tax=Alloacidobacterium sp. TaxID=2951999 RepID=UPI002D546146|nr:CDP-archaeol synthase [Alloacidobacterium sp.]HYK36207.1 CDP-archaeol synthase [Alloacidobacterium sp.]